MSESDSETSSSIHTPSKPSSILEKKEIFFQKHKQVFRYLESMFSYENSVHCIDEYFEMNECIVNKYKKMIRNNNKLEDTNTNNKNINFDNCYREASHHFVCLMKHNK